MVWETRLEKGVSREAGKRGNGGGGGWELRRCFCK